MLQYTNGPTFSTPVIIDTRGMSRCKMSKQHRVRFALEADEGNVFLKLSKQMIAQAFGVSVASMNRARRGSRKPPTDEQVDRLIAKFGVDAIWAGLDRLTAPLAQAAE
ncbi:hypothetical protein Q2941_32470 [Bradyrhizobium sp. UFLA05-153]